MKQILSTLLLTLSMPALAVDVKIINIGAATSPTAMYANAYAKNLDIPNTFVPAKSCRDAIAIAKKESSVLLITNDVYLQANRLRQNCSFNFEPKNILIMSDAYFEVCKKPDIITSLNAKNVKVGRASVHPIKEWEYDFNQRNQTSVKGVAFSGSKTVLTAVLNGDVEWGIIAREIADPAIKEGRIVCPYNTEASSPKSLHRYFDMINDEYVLKYMLIAFTSDEKLLKELKKAAIDKNFLQYLEVSHHSNINTQLTKNDIDLYLDSIKQLRLLFDINIIN